MAPWVKRDPHSGGTRIPEKVRERVKQRLLKYGEEHYKGKYERLDIRFRGHFCYIDAYIDPKLPPDWPRPGSLETREEAIERIKKIPTHLCRLRYFGNEERWSFAFYTYSDEKYKPCMFRNGTFYGTPEEAFAQSSIYLQ